MRFSIENEIVQADKLRLTEHEVKVFQRFCHPKALHAIHSHLCIVCYILKRRIRQRSVQSHPQARLSDGKTANIVEKLSLPHLSVGYAEILQP
jgi:hypothetical protein